MLVAVPALVVTVIWPLVAPTGTVVTILVELFDTMIAGTPWKAIPLAPIRLRPVIITVAPTAPDLGDTLRIVGVTVVVIRPIEGVTYTLVNQRAPSGPRAIAYVPLMPVAE